MPEQTKAPADRSASFLRRLHPVTRLIIAAGLLHLCGDIAAVLHLLWLHQNSMASEGETIAQTFANGAHALAYTVSFFGTAATVEYMFRIWQEVALMRRNAD